MIRKLSCSIILLVYVQSANSQQLTREKYNWMLNCQGCHGAQGKVSAIDTPVLNGGVARFLNVEGGREYLLSVPGVVNAAINDEDKANLLTWIVKSFDPAHVPADFQPFTVEDVEWGRNNPLLTRAAKRREELLERLEDQ